MSSFSSDDDEEELGDAVVGDLQSYLEDTSQVNPEEKIQYVVNLCFVYIKDFSTDVHPYNHKLFKSSKKRHKMSNTLLKKYILYRDPATKLSNKKQPELLTILKSDQFKLSDNDLSFLNKEIETYKSLYQAMIDEANPNSDTSLPADRTNITTTSLWKAVHFLLKYILAAQELK